MANRNFLFLLALYTATISSALLFILPPSHGQDNGYLFKECQQLYSCGNLTKIPYPFYGNGRPPYCGSLGFELDCRNNRSFIHMGQQQEFLVLNISASPPHYTMTLARNDLLEDPCSSQYFDTRIDPALFSFTQDYIENITIHYHCNLGDSNKGIPPYIYNFTCGAQYAVYEDMISTHGTAWSGCDISTVVPVILSPMDEPEGGGGQGALRKALDRGFDVNYKVNWSQCIPCRKSSGYCGSNETDNGFSCICETGQFSQTCPPSTCF